MPGSATSGLKSSGLIDIETEVNHNKMFPVSEPQCTALYWIYMLSSQVSKSIQASFIYSNDFATILSRNAYLAPVAMPMGFAE
jgi:hypothetical protein